MQPITQSTFGPLIAFLVPGITVLVGLSDRIPILRTWFAETPNQSPTIGGFLYLTVTASAGMTVSAIRWAVIDTLHARTGLAAPRLDWSRLTGNVEALSMLIRIHYEHYQFYANMFIAVAIGYGNHRVTNGGPPSGLDAAILCLEGIFFLGSRDTLRKYYSRSRALLAKA